MTRSQVAALIAGLCLVAVVSAAGGFWLYSTGRVTTLASLVARPDVAATQSTPAQPAPARPAQSQAGPAQATPSQSPQAAPSQASPPRPQREAKAEIAPLAAPAPAPPSFDIVRVEPRGDTVVAGKGEPNAKVALLARGKVVGEAQADSNGQFVILPPPLKPGDYDLTLRQTSPGKAAAASTQSVAVSVPKLDKGPVVVALAEPGKATKLLSRLPGAAATTVGHPPAPLPAGNVAIRSAELENGTGFFASGAAAAGAHVRLYLNDAHIADVVAAPDGAWSVRVKRGLTGGHYVVRADLGSSGGHAVASRVEVPFDVPLAMAAAQPPSISSDATPGANKGASAALANTPDVADATPAAGPDATLDAIATARVTHGDNLWNISRYRLGEGKRYTQIYAANVEQIRDPNLIYPGQVFVVPAK